MHLHEPPHIVQLTLLHIPSQTIPIQFPVLHFLRQNWFRNSTRLCFPKAGEGSTSASVSGAVQQRRGFPLWLVLLGASMIQLLLHLTLHLPEHIMPCKSACFFLHALKMLCARALMSVAQGQGNNKSTMNEEACN